MMRKKKEKKNTNSSQAKKRAPKIEDVSFDQSEVRLFGNALNDGVVNLNFTLPMPKSGKAEKVAKIFAEKMGLKDIQILSSMAIDKNFTHFTLRAISDVVVNAAEMQGAQPEKTFNFRELNKLLKKKVKRKVFVVGASLDKESDTVSMDTLFNRRGYLGDSGLESYPMLKAVNYRAEFEMSKLAKKIADLQVDAVVVSKIASKRDDPVVDLRKFLRELDKMDGVPKHLVKICVGPRVTEKFAKDIGYDFGFGAGTLPSQVATFITDAVIDRIGN